MPSEFQLISQYFGRQSHHDGVMLGIGDDAALLQIPTGEVLVATTDTFISGRHFPENTHPFAIGHKALAVNLSDLAAMGATPRWFLLALTLPDCHELFLSEFSRGLFNLAKNSRVALVGGDTTKGALSITITALGTVPFNQALTRHQAHVGDGVYVSGTIGDAGLGLQVALGKTPPALSDDFAQYVKGRLDFPQPRVQLGLALRGLASACLDVSDGLAQDLGHILQASHVGADIELEKLPLSASLKSLAIDEAWQLALTSGDDYELCFTLSDDAFAKLPALDVPITRIGTISETSGLRFSHHGLAKTMNVSGYQHF